VLHLGRIFEVVVVRRVAVVVGHDGRLPLGQPGLAVHVPLPLRRLFPVVAMAGSATRQILAKP
jgi:hypothetical protein